MVPACTIFLDRLFLNSSPMCTNSPYFSTMVVLAPESFELNLFNVSKSFPFCLYMPYMCFLCLKFFSQFCSGHWIDFFCSFDNLSSYSCVWSDSKIIYLISFQCFYLFIMTLNVFFGQRGPGAFIAFLHKCQASYQTLQPVS